MQEKTINGLRVCTQQLKVRRAYALIPKLGAIVGPALTHLEGFDNADFMKRDIKELAPAFMSIFTALDESDADDLLARTFERTQVVRDGKVLDLSNASLIDEAFAGDLMGMLEAAWFVLGVNFADFFAGASKIKGVAVDAKSNAPQENL